MPNTLENIAQQKEIENAEKIKQEQEKEVKEWEEKQIIQPFEDVLASIFNQNRWTAAFTITKIFNKPTRTLADTGASHSVVCRRWLKYLGLEDSIRPTDMVMLDAQKNKIPVAGVVTLPVTFGNKEFEWEMRVSDELICPMILGMDVLHTGGVNCAKRLVEIDGETQPITITLGELDQPSVLAATNRVVNPYSYGMIQGKIIHDKGEHDASMHGGTYILNAGGIIRANQLVTSTKHKAENAKEISEYVPIQIFNGTGKKMCIKKGTILATAEAVTGDTLNALTEYTVERVIDNYAILASVKFSDTITQHSPTQEVGNSNPVTQEGNTMVMADMPSCCNSVTYHALGIGIGVLKEREGTPEIMVSPNSNSATVTSDSTGIEPQSSKGIMNSQAAQINLELPRRETRTDGPFHLSETPRDSSMMQQGRVEGVNTHGPFEVSNHNNTLKHDWSQQCSVHKAEEQRSLIDKPMQESTWAQDTSKAQGLPEGSLCALDNDTIAKTVSELREEVLSYQMFKQVEEGVNALLKDNQLSSSVVGKDQREGQQTKEEGSIEGGNTKEHLEHLQQNLVKETGLINEEDCLKEIKDMVSKAECDETQKAELEAIFLESKEQFLPGFTKDFPAGSSFFVPHEINLAQEYPVWIPQFKQSVMEKNIIEENNQQMLKALKDPRALGIHLLCVYSRKIRLGGLLLTIEKSIRLQSKNSGLSQGLMKPMTLSAKPNT